MSSRTVAGVTIRGIASAVPDNETSWEAHVGVFGEEARRIADATGVRRRAIVSEGQCASDLCFAAAERLLLDLSWERESVTLLIFVSQTPDYVLPATSCVLQRRLRLSTDCAAFDISLGCSGYVYGLWLAAQLLAGGSGDRALLLVGDTISRLVSPEDRSTAMLFGDAGSATALETETLAAPMTFRLGSDGNGAPHLKATGGGFRRPTQPERTESHVRPPGEHLVMDGAEVFAFAQRVVPPLVNDILQDAGASIETIDWIAFHQANAFMINHLTKRLNLPPNKVLLALDGFGNTSSASIPLAISSLLRAPLEAGPLRLLLCGFGVGWSWGAAVLTCGPIVAPPVLSLSV